MIRNRFIRNADGSSAGGGLPPSLADLENLTPQGSSTPPSEPPSSPPPAVPPADSVEGLDADGNLLEGYEQLEDGTIQKITEPLNDDADSDISGEEISADEFWQSVNTLTGKPVEVDYGDIDPLSPEGVAMRESAVRDSAVSEFDQYIRDTYPRAYAYFLHTQNGGSDEEFFAEPSLGLLSKAAFEQDPDAQANLILSDLQRKGVPQDIAQSAVDSYIKKNELKEKALNLYSELEKMDQQRLAEMEEATQRQQHKFFQAVRSLNDTIATTIKSDMKLVVPEAKQTEFQKFVIDRIQHDGEKFYMVQPVEKESMSVALDALYLQFVKGDLKTLVEKRAQTKAVQRLGQRVKADASRSSSTSSATSQKGYIPLSEI